MVLLGVVPVALQFAVCVVLRLSVKVPENVAVLLTPAQVSGQLNRKQTLKLMEFVFVQDERLAIVTVSTPVPELFVTDIQAGNTDWQVAS